MAQSSTRSRRWWAPVAIGLIAIAMIFVVIFSNKSPAALPGAAEEPAATPPAVTAPPEVSEPQRLHLDRREADDPLAVGNLDAPVALVMYSDFQCGYCALWAHQTLPTLVDYVERGELRIEWRDVAFFGDASYRAALAAAAAGIQGSYLEFNQEVFAGGSTPSTSVLSNAGLEEIARKLDLDVDKFRTDLDAPETAAIVEANIAEASNLGVSSTPTFLLNGLAVFGAQPVDVFVAALDEELRLNS